MDNTFSASKVLTFTNQKASTEHSDSDWLNIVCTIIKPVLNVYL